MKLVGFSILIIISLVFVGCSKPETQHPTEPIPVTLPAEEPIPEETSKPEQNGSTSGDIDTVRQLIAEYWEAMNSYDVERTLSYYEEQYQELEEEEVKNDIGRLKQFSVTLTVADISEPVFIDEDKVRCEIILDTPIGDKNLVYFLERINGEWRIYLETSSGEFVEAEEFIIDFLTKYEESHRMDIIINAEQQQDIQRATTEYVLAELINSGEIVESSQGVYSLPGE